MQYQTLIYLSTKFSPSYYHFPQYTLQCSYKILYRSVGQTPVSHDQQQNSHPLEQAGVSTVSLSFYSLFLLGGGKFVLTFLLMGWFLYTLRYTKPRLGSVTSFRCTFMPSQATAAEAEGASCCKNTSVASDFAVSLF